MSLGENDKQTLEISIGKKFIQGTEKTKSLYSFARIYKLPEDLCNMNKNAYIPRLIAIGPFHQNSQNLQNIHMQDIKLDYANNLFLRLTKGTEDPKIRDEKKDKALQECLQKMKECRVKAKKYDTEEKVTLLQKARKYYAEDLNLNDEEMAEMMLVDGCFILELLYVSYHTNYCQVQNLNSNRGESGSKSNRTGCEQPRANPIFDNLLTANIVKHDLMLLENQIPFFVLEHLFHLTVAKIPDRPITGCPHKLSLEDYINSYFREFCPKYSSRTTNTCCFSPNNDCVLSVRGRRKEIEEGSEESGKTDENYHMLHLIHSSYIPCEQGGKNELGIREISTKHSELTLSASDLHYAGVKFVPTRNLSDVKFINKGIFGCRTVKFRIPTLYIRNTTESFLRNVIALEQCSPLVPRYFTSYAKLMDMFINSEEDVRVLIKKKVLHNYLSTDKDVCDLFNKLCKEVVLEDFHFNDECRNASNFNMHWQTRAVRYVTRLLVASPWPALAFCLGIITCALTVYQFGSSFHKRPFQR